MVRASIASSLGVSRFHVGPVDLHENWSEIDASDPAVVEVLKQYMPSHVRIHPDDVVELAKVGIHINELGRIADPAKDAPKSDAPKAPHDDGPHPHEHAPRTQPPAKSPSFDTTDTSDLSTPPPSAGRRGRDRDR